jgi:hypothetical protein
MEAEADHTAPARLVDETRDGVASVARWIVVSHPFNAAWYPQLVDSQGEGDPPSYAVVRLVWESSTREL